MFLGPLIGAIHEGFTSVLFAIYKAGTDEIVCYHEKNVPHICPKEGWVEQDPLLIMIIVVECIEGALKKLIALGGENTDIIAIGITNQRESTVLWDKTFGLPLYNAIISTDIRTLTTVEHLLNITPNNDINYLKEYCGLPLSSYFSALKIRWLIDNVQIVRKTIEHGNCLFGTIDTWIIWNLTGGINGGIHITDVTNACRTMLMNIETRKWDPFLLKYFNIPLKILPEIRSSAEFYGRIILTSLNCPITSCLGDQQAELIGKQCIEKGQATCSYDFDCILLYNTGSRRYYSENGLITTIAYQFGKNARPMYALEGRVSHAGLATQWVRKKLKLTNSTTFVEDSNIVADCEGVYFVPAFSGLNDPHWDLDARGIIVGLSETTTKCHIIRASFEAICYQVRDIIEAMERDSGRELKKIIVTGEIIKDKLFMQLLSDLAGIEIIVQKMRKSTAALGAALAAYHPIIEYTIKLKVDPNSNIIYKPKLTEENRISIYEKWKLAVQKCCGWKSMEAESTFTINSIF